MLKSSPRPALALLSALSLGSVSASCASAPPISPILAAVQCRVPDSLRRDVPPAPLPADDTAGAWVAFGDAQTGRLDVANANKAAVVEIVDGCNTEQAALLEALKPKPWWARLRPG